MADSWQSIALSLYIRVFAAQVMLMDDAWGGKELRSSFWRLYVNNREGAVVGVNGERTELEKDKVYVLPAWTAFQTENHCPLQHYYIHFDVIGLPVALIREFFDRPFQVHRDAALDGHVRCWQRAMDCPEAHGLASICHIKALVYTAMASLFDGLTKDQQARCARFLREESVVSPALDFIDRHLGQPLENTVLATHCGVGVDHFIRAFKQFTGQTPAQYVLDLRVKRAAHMLVFSNETIESVAADNGFSDRFHFSKVFAKRMGLPPATYRKTAGLG